MNPDEVNTYVIQILWDLYPKTFEPPSVPQFLLWCRALAPYERSTAVKALDRWVEWHRQTPPELGEIVRDCKQIDYEAARWQAPADALPFERSPVQGLVMKYMAHINQRLLGPCQDDTGQVYPRLSLAEVPALLRTLSAAHREHPELAYEFGVLSTEYAAMAPPIDSPFEQAVRDRGPSPARAKPGVTMDVDCDDAARQRRELCPVSQK